MLHTDRQRKERILVFGAPKSSKTRSWASIVEMSLDSDVKFYVADSDYRAVQSLEHIDNWEKVCDISTPQTWEELVTWTDMVQEQMNPNDWLVFDLITHAWNFVITYYIEQVMNKKPGQFFLDFKKGGGKGNPMAGAYGENWNVINAMYRDWIMKVIRTRGHVFACSSSKKLDVEQDDSNVKKLFGPVGVKPEGQKDLGYQFDSILLTGFGKSTSEWRLTTVGDTNRERVTDMPLENFALEYLVKVGGWKL